MTTIKPKPEGYNSVTPSLTFKDSNKAIEFYKELFGATEKYRLEYNNKMVHAEIKIGDTNIMLADEMPEMHSKSAQTIGDTPIQLYIYADNVDSTFAKAIKMGAKEDFPVKTQFYGDRTGAFTDPFGYKWTVATKVKDVSMEQIKANLKDFVEHMDKPATNNDYQDKYLKYKQKYLELKESIAKKLANKS